MLLALTNFCTDVFLMNFMQNINYNNPEKFCIVILLNPMLQVLVCNCTFKCVRIAHYYVAIHAVTWEFIARIFCESVD